jgi:predicted metalloprotease with PDZ domain
VQHSMFSGSRRGLRRAGIGIGGFLAATALAAHADPIHLEVDLRDATRRIYHAHETIPVAPGALGLRYAKWIPGEHSPSGPVVDLTGLRFRAGGKPIGWERNAVDPWRIELVVPPGVDEIEVELDYLVPSKGGEFTGSPAASAKLAVLAWNSVVLYPEGIAAAEIEIEPSLRLPAGWKAATALRAIGGDRGGRIRYAKVSLETLVDSPVAAGLHTRAVPLDAPAGAPEHVVHLVADSPEALAPKEEVLAPLRSHLVPETLALFGAHHYPRYDFLFALSDHVGHFGLEHHASSDNRLPERTLLEEQKWLTGAGLLPHEFVHSWNAKYRRPEGLATRDYHTPMVGDLLWVYEGLTSYLGDVLTARAGLVSEEQAREGLALQAAVLAHTKGREWRPLGDTTRDAQHTYTARWEGASWRRGVDFYDEGVMLWLEVDALIRGGSGGRKSLDDFCRVFFGPPSGDAEVRAFTRGELVAALHAVSPRDWDAFFRARVDGLRPDPPVEGIEAAGWKLVYDEKPNAFAEAYATLDDAGNDLRFSLGAFLAKDGGVEDVVPNGPLARAGIGVGSKIVAVDSRAYTQTVLEEALKSAARRGGKVELLARNADFFSTHVVEYAGGPRHPHLVRDASKPDWLTPILAPRTWQRAAKSEAAGKATTAPSPTSAASPETAASPK